MTVETITAAAQDYVKSVTKDADLALFNAQIAVMLVGYDPIVVAPTTLPNPPPSTLALVPPVFDTVTLEMPPEPGTLSGLLGISLFDPGIAPIFTASTPSYDAPNKPNQVADFTLAPPAINTSIVFPSPPSALLAPVLDAPILLDRVEPARPQTLLPGFSAVAPVDTTTAPTDLSGTFDAAYRNAAPSTITMVNGYVDAMMAKYNPSYADQMAAIETQLAKYLAGGTGLNAAVENAIYERARSKTNADSIRVQRANWDDAAKRGFTLPTGALISGNHIARQAAADNNAVAAREIVVMQAEMEQKNLQFAVTQSANLRQTMLSASLAYMQNLVGINGQALDYAKSILGAVVEAYNISVKSFGLRLDAYRAEAAVFETRLKSALAGIELYKLEIQALEALTQVDRTKVDIYRARIETLTVYANVYRAQIEAVQGRVNLEKLNLDVFKTQVDAYSAQVQGKNAEWMGYKSQIEGQVAKFQVFDAQAKVFREQVMAYKTTLEGKSEVIRAQAITNQALSGAYSATLSGYKAVVEARGEKARAEVENQRQRVNLFQVTAQAEVGRAQVASEYYKAVSNVGLANSRLELDKVVAKAASKKDFLSTLTALNTSNANVHASLAGAALSGINTLASQIKNE